MATAAQAAMLEEEKMHKQVRTGCWRRRRRGRGRWCCPRTAGRSSCR